MEMNPHTKELARVMRHILTVQALLNGIAHKLSGRALAHDLSKLSPDELGGMIEINIIADEFGLNSPEYMEALEGDAIQLHRSRHSHHPEYHDGGFQDMSPLDVIEMTCDWKAANMLRGHPEWHESVEMMVERLGLSVQEFYFVKAISQLLED